MQKRKATSDWKYTARTKDLPATHGMLHLVRSELKSDLRSLRSEMRSGFDQIDARFNQTDSKLERVLSEVARIATIVENTVQGLAHRRR